MLLFILFGGELFLIVAVVRVAVCGAPWLARLRRGSTPGPPGPPGGLPLARPQLVLLRGGKTRAAGPPKRGDCGALHIPVVR